MADKLTQTIVDALARAAADPAGVPLHGTKADPGLFPAAAKPAAQKALADGLLRVVRTETKGKQARELCAATEKGLRFLLERVSPKQVLEDFVRVLEERQGQVTELLGAAHRLADTLDGLRAAVAVVLPRVEAARVVFPPSPLGGEGPGVRGESLTTAPALPLTPNPSPPRGEGDRTRRLGTPAMNGVATPEAAVAADLDDLAGVVLARLSDWSASAGAGEDCPLPELYRSLTTRDAPPTIGAFHDCLRQLHDGRHVYLHPWTGPLYALPEPAYALMVGHNVAYYASTRLTA